MASSRESSQECRHEDNFTGSVLILDYYVDAPQSWFCSINASYTVSRAKHLTKFYWALSKLG
jgi:hypothetical protein